MKLCVNWLPVSAELTRELARRVEHGGLWGMGIGDSPNYGEVYASCADALGVTERIVVATSVTNPVTRHVSVHTSAARGFAAAAPGRFRLGMGRGDSAVHAFGLKPASLTQLEETALAVGAQAPDVARLIAASGPKTAAMAGRCAHGLIAGVGADRSTVDKLRACAETEHDGQPFEVWASVRLAVGRTAEEIGAIRARLVPRAVSAAHFAFGAGVGGRNVPEEFGPVLRDRFARYDYAFHGRSARSTNATLFADRPDIEDYLLRRFAVFGTHEQCRAQLDEIAEYADGIYLSLLFEDVLDQVDRVTQIYDTDGPLAVADRE